MMLASDSKTLGSNSKRFKNIEVSKHFNFLIKSVWFYYFGTKHNCVLTEITRVEGITMHPGLEAEQSDETIMQNICVKS